MAQTLESSRVTLRPNGSEQFLIRLELVLSPGADNAPMRHVGLKSGSQRVDRVLVSAQDRTLPIRFRAAPSQWILEFSLPRSIREYEVEYEVEMQGTRRIPILVPILPLQGEALIRILTGDGLELQGTSFPRFERAGGAFQARLGDLPSFLIAPLVAPAEQSSLGRLLTVSIITDLGLLAIILAASLYWWYLRRRASRTLSAAIPVEERGK